MSEINMDRMGRMAAIRYKGGISGQDIIDDRSQGEPLQIILGEGMVPRGIEEALFQMEVGETRTIVIPPEKGYGDYAEQLVSWYPRMVVPHGTELHVGQGVTWQNPSDFINKRYGWIVEETEDNLRIDFNHPLAGETLEYTVEFVSLS